MSVTISLDVLRCYPDIADDIGFFKTLVQNRCIIRMNLLIRLVFDYSVRVRVSE